MTAEKLLVEGLTGSGSANQASTRPLALINLIPWLLVGVFVAVGFSSVVPPAALPVDAPASDFSAARAVAHIEVIAQGPHPTGSTAIAAGPR